MPQLYFQFVLFEKSLFFRENRLIYQNTIPSAPTEIPQNAPESQEPISPKEYIKENLKDFQAILKYPEIKRLVKNPTMQNQETFVLWYIAYKISNYRGDAILSDLKSKVFTEANKDANGFYFKENQWYFNDSTFFGLGGDDMMNINPTKSLIEKLKEGLKPAWMGDSDVFDHVKSSSKNVEAYMNSSSNELASQLTSIINEGDEHFKILNALYNQTETGFSHVEKTVDEIVSEEKNCRKKITKEDLQKLSEDVLGDARQSLVNEVEVNLQKYLDQSPQDEFEGAIYWLALNKGFQEPCELKALQDFFSIENTEKNRLHFENGRWYASFKKPTQTMAVKMGGFDKYSLLEIIKYLEEVDPETASVLTAGKNLFPKTLQINESKKPLLVEEQQSLTFMSSLPVSIKWLLPPKNDQLKIISVFKTKPSDWFFLKTSDDDIYAKNTTEKLKWNKDQGLWEKLEGEFDLKSEDYSQANEDDKIILSAINELTKNPPVNLEENIKKIPLVLKGPVSFEKNYDNLKLNLQDLFTKQLNLYPLLEKNPVVETIATAKAEQIIKHLEKTYLPSDPNKTYTFDPQKMILVGENTIEFKKKNEEKKKKEEVDTSFEEKIEKAAQIPIIGGLYVTFLKFQKRISTFLNNTQRKGGLGSVASIISFFAPSWVSVSPEGKIEWSPPQKLKDLPLNKDLPKVSIDNENYVVPAGQELIIPEKKYLTLPDPSFIEINGKKYQDYQNPESIPNKIPAGTKLPLGTILPKGCKLTPLPAPQPQPIQNNPNVTIDPQAFQEAGAAIPQNQPQLQPKPQPINTTPTPRLAQQPTPPAKKPT